MRTRSLEGNFKTCL